MTIKIKSGSFSAASKLYSASPDGLAAILKGLAADNAQSRLQVAAILDWTDNTTGTFAEAFFDLNVAPAVFDATSAGGAQRAAINTAIGKIKNVEKVIVNALNLARVKIGLDSMSVGEGTEAAASTLPAQDKTVASASGTSAVDHASWLVTAAEIKENQRLLIYGFQEVYVALGNSPIPDLMTGSVVSFDQVEGELNTITAVTAASTGASSVAVANVNTFLTDLANNWATMAVAWNEAIGQAAGIQPLRVVASF